MTTLDTLIEKAAFNALQSLNPLAPEFAREYQGKAEGIVIAIAALTDRTEDDVRKDVIARMETMK